MRRVVKSSIAWMAAAILSLAWTANAGETVRIGVMGPVTGAWASEGQDMERVVRTLAERVNSSNSANGRSIEILVGDDAGDPRTAALAAQRLVDSGVVAVVGTYGSSITEASQDIYHDEEVVQIATGSTAIRLSEKGMPLFFRTCPRDDDQGRVMARTVQEMGVKRIALLHDNTSYAKGLADETATHLRDMGMELVFNDAITPGDRDYNITLVKMRSQDPEIIVFTGYFPEAGMLLRQKKDMKWDVPMIGGDATNNTALIEIAGQEAADGYYFISPPGPLDLVDPDAIAFIDEYRARYDSVPSSVWAMLAGDAFSVLVEAVSNISGPVTSETIGDYLHNQLKDFQGFTGPIAFDGKGDRVGDVYRLYQVDSQGHFVLVN